MRKVSKVKAGPKSYVVSCKNEKVEIPQGKLITDRCRECQVSYPVVYNNVYGEAHKRKPLDPFGSVEPYENKSQAEKWLFWREQMDKCVRCYACRSVCAMCYCEECVVDSIKMSVTAETSAKEKAQKIKWIEKSPDLSENFGYHLVRAIHLAGRCIDCGECERVCPVNIPLRLLNKKLEKDTKQLFDYEAGMSADQPALVSSFRDEDPEQFIR